MGGCCCCPSRSELNRTPVHLYCHQAPEECETLSAVHDTTSAISHGLLVHTKLETSSPNTYQAPPAPLPYDMGVVCSQTSSQIGSKTDQMQLTEAQPLRENVNGGSFEGCMSLESDHKYKSASGHGSSEVAEDGHSKLSASVISSTEEEDVCPTCLEEHGTCASNLPLADISSLNCPCIL